MQKEQILKDAIEGDINAFQKLFAEFQDALKSYLYRLLTSRSDADDLTHDTFIRAFDKLHLYQGKSSLKTWVFRIATNLAYNELKKRKRWTEDVSAKAKDLVLGNPQLAASLERLTRQSHYATYDIKEHIDTCFTCIAKNLMIEKQVVIILKDIYDFSIKEIVQIVDSTEGKVKYWLQTARKTLSEIFDRRCALVHKNGICHQCSELNAWFNPKQQQQEALVSIKMVRNAEKLNQKKLYQLRAELVKQIDPLKSSGNELQEALLNCNRIAMEEVEKF